MQNGRLCRKSHGAQFLLRIRGQSNAAVEVQVGENLTGESRSAVLEIVSTDGVLKEEIHVSQLAEVFSENHHYKLPVVFQVLYVNKSDKNQYVEEGHLQKLLDKVNELYRNCGEDLGLEFVMATEDGRQYLGRTGCKPCHVDYIYY